MTNLRLTTLFLMTFGVFSASCDSANFSAGAKKKGADPVKTPNGGDANPKDPNDPNGTGDDKPRVDCTGVSKDACQKKIDDKKKELGNDNVGAQSSIDCTNKTVEECNKSKDAEKKRLDGIDDKVTAKNDPSGNIDDGTGSKLCKESDKKEVVNSASTVNMPLLKAPGSSNYNPAKQWLGDGKKPGAPPVLVTSELKPGDKVLVKDVNGKIYGGNKNLNGSCLNGVAGQVYYKFTLMFQFTNDADEVLKIVKSTQASGAISARELQSTAMAIPKGATKMYASIPDSRYDDNDTLCNFTLEIQSKKAGCPADDSASTSTSSDSDK